ncbi:hypothetical protein ILUMI_14571 [Ignelater luminosus]|uniref:Uncharacterized protein n=1 Tax=Ignelater luminosus TaxID=2038154 RepID=A0A8K0CUJ0_IGNLU|nr:hypothetical protein ILUMI_14571 [Ignelater luminosus]
MFIFNGCKLLRGRFPQVIAVLSDSPYYLLLKDTVIVAKESLELIRSSGDVKAEMKEIAVAVERQKSERGKFIDTLIVDSNRKATLIMTVLNGT